MIKCEACQAFYRFFATSIINSMIHRQNVMPGFESKNKKMIIVHLKETGWFQKLWHAHAL